jgi:hypothetical protein
MEEDNISYYSSDVLSKTSKNARVKQTKTLKSPEPSKTY